MRHMLRMTIAVVIVLVATGVSLSADRDRDHDRDDDRNELRIRRNQSVILEATPDCDTGMITIRGENYGTGYVPHVTLNLIELDVVGAYDNGVVAYLPPSLCDTPGTYLLTVMRAEMNHGRRWLRLKATNGVMLLAKPSWDCGDASKPLRLSASARDRARVSSARCRKHGTSVNPAASVAAMRFAPAISSYRPLRRRTSTGWIMPNSRMDVISGPRS